MCVCLREWRARRVCTHAGSRFRTIVWLCAREALRHTCQARAVASAPILWWRLRRRPQSSPQPARRSRGSAARTSCADLGRRPRVSGLCLKWCAHAARGGRGISPRLPLRPSCGAQVWGRAAVAAVWRCCPRRSSPRRPLPPSRQSQVGGASRGADATTVWGVSLLLTPPAAACAAGSEPARPP